MKKKKQKKLENKFLSIHLAIYRCTVVISWEPDVNKIMKIAKKYKCPLDEDWKKRFLYCQEGASGIAIRLGDDNAPDVLVWLKDIPKKASEYESLYHELYHAVEFVGESHNLKAEWEARAYIYGYLATVCNKYFWNK